jgi:dephospho-CoA kinase
VFCADFAVDELYRNCSETLQYFHDNFPETMLNGKIDKEIVRKKILLDSYFLLEIEKFFHPKIRIFCAKFLEKKEDEECFVLDIPLLLEMGMQNLVDKVICVVLSDEARVNRMKWVGNRNYELFQCLERRQWKESKKLALADCIVDNNGSKEVLSEQITDLYNKNISNNNIKRFL